MQEIFMALPLIEIVIFMIVSRKYGGIREYMVHRNNKGRVIGTAIGFIAFFSFGIAFAKGTHNAAWGMISIWNVFAHIILLLVVLIYRPRPVYEAPRDDHGSARWSTMKEFWQAIDTFIDEKGMIKEEGLWVSNGSFRRTIGNLLTVAAPRSGKGSIFIIPNLLMNPFGSYVVTDPKGENACVTALYQKKAGQKVYILDPWDEQMAIRAKHGIPAAGFNPFDFLRRNMSVLTDNCDMISYYLIPLNPESRDPYWDQRARSLIKLLLVHIVTSQPIEKQNFWTLYKMLRLDNQGLASLIDDMKQNPAYDGYVQSGANEIWSLAKTETTWGNVLSVAQNGTTIFESSKLRESLLKSEFDPYELPNGDCTVYIVIPEQYQISHSAWLRMVVGLCLKAVNAKPNKRVNFLLDEAGILGKMESIPQNYAFGPGQNIVMWAYFQSLSQVKQIYGEAGMESLVSTTDHLIAFNVQDQFTREYISKLLGDTTRTRFEESEGPSGTTTSEKAFGRPLMTPEEVGNCPLLINIGKGFKIKLTKDYYFDPKERFKDRGQPPPRIH